MLATLQLHGRSEPRLCVPASAVVRENDTDYVFVQTAPGRFTLRPVSLGPEHGSMRVLLGGVARGEQIVLDGAFHLNNERRRRVLRGGEGA